MENPSKKGEEEAKTPKKEPKQEADIDVDDEDNVPLALTKAKKKKPIVSSSAASKVKDEDFDPEEADEKPKKVLKGKSNVKPSKVKKELSDDSEEEEKRGKKRKRAIKEGLKKKMAGKVKKEEAGAKVKKEKKVYDLPGQKHDPPEERDPLRIFYESLHEQVPNSEMAAVWMMEWGLLPPQEAKKVYEKKLLKGQQQKLRSPSKMASVKKITVSVKKDSVKKTVFVKKEAKPKVVGKKIPKKGKGSDSESDYDDDDFLAKPAAKSVAKKTPKKRKGSDSESDDDDDDDDFVALSDMKKRKMSR